MSKKNRPTDSGGNWMDTYGDMVTLLLTFFIMLYSMSNLDAQKWTIFVKSIPSIQNQGSENITINSQRWIAKARRSARRLPRKLFRQKM